MRVLCGRIFLTSGPGPPVVALCLRCAYAVLTLCLLCAYAAKKNYAIFLASGPGPPVVAEDGAGIELVSGVGRRWI